MDYFTDIIRFPQSSDERKNKTFADAFQFANSCRDKEIDRFWSRGLYFWGFITASFAAYMTVFILALGQNENGVQNMLCLQNILAMSFISKFILFVLAFVCFVFCLSWQLAHKASKYWQENWEKHITYLEENYIGRIYDSSIILKEGCCPFSVKSYNYSVSKISSLCSILLSLVSLGLVFFHAVILISISIPLFQECRKCLLAIGVIALAVTFIVFYFICSLGNKKQGNNELVFRKAEIPPCRVE